jgi:hypothetical protein
MSYLTALERLSSGSNIFRKMDVTMANSIEEEKIFAPHHDNKKEEMPWFRECLFNKQET